MQEIKRIATFCAVGVINTLMDFVVLDLLHLKAGMATIPANLISTTVAMLFSFFANRTVVFKHHSEKVWRQMLTFWLVTAFGLYVLQSGIIWLFAHPFWNVTESSVRLARDVGLKHLSAGFITTNSVKLVADLVTLVWNYILYKKVVFVEKPHTEKA